MINSLHHSPLKSYFDIMYNIGKKIPPKINDPILTSTVQITCLVGMIGSFYIQNKLEGQIQLLNDNHYQHNSYQVIRIAQRFFLNYRLARIVARIVFKYPITPVFFFMPLSLVTWLNAPYIAPKFLDMAKTISVATSILIIFQEEIIRGN
jgi:hypothetical protein